MQRHLMSISDINRMCKSKIANDDITLVFQGPWNASLHENVERARETLPGAAIVIGSTDPRVKNDVVEGAQVALVQDPGELPAYKRGRNAPVNNVNRQIASSRAGLARVKTPYAVKIRTDCSIRAKGFIDIYEHIARESGNSARLLASSIYTLHPEGIEALPFHVSDWFFFGETSVLHEYFDVPLMSSQDANWYGTENHDIRANHFARQYRSRWSPEQYIAVENARKGGYVVPSHLGDTRSEVIDSYALFLAEKFVICDLSEFGFMFEKYQRAAGSNFQFFNCVWGSDWSTLAANEKNSVIATESVFSDKGPTPAQRRAVVSLIRRLDRTLGLLKTCGLMPLIGDVLGIVRRLNYRG
ncbi:WavE lipopolysaccharide synthesis family protein [Burkholderia vietnamiensis]|uniref:WavE lipopolysaccharide synthesis family protein n=1 Tax=Burkholderia vietnamiensis TaxID=60552 RepID=UPI00159316FD|nr:WavE lipopolysaccharide synthesis family protein [Burkholderia vietnamiensis]MCA8068896.1 WavE lipopolysaccharide synthesis family protein [Burkholderia vietnamiensis]UEC04716.1 WavE lipopolysaccharide synthesis family protein [Burkholderia vietnamiensis]HDR8988596.1 hypothetical protein [Burkholderia vietnamiensis]